MYQLAEVPEVFGKSDEALRQERSRNGWKQFQKWQDPDGPLLVTSTCELKKYAAVALARNPYGNFLLNPWGPDG